jgi:putative acetyltransferase
MLCSFLSCFWALDFCKIRLFIVHTINILDYALEQINAWAPPEIDSERWLHHFKHHITFVAISGTQIVGFGDATKEGLIYHMYTHKNFQRQGIATSLLKKLEEELQKLSITKIITEASITAKPFFEKQGYSTLYSQEKKHRSGIMFLNYIMHKHL